jgi:opacity protein-like surface antigen
MKMVSIAAVAAAALTTVAGVSAPVAAADLRSMKDGYAGPMPVLQSGPAGPCYFRADVGYSWSQSPDIKWPVNNGVHTDGSNGNPADGIVQAGEISYSFVTDKVANASMENTWFGEGGAGCSFGGSRGVRFEAMLGYRGDRKIDGEPGFYQPAPPVGVPPVIPPVLEDPLHTSLRTYTLMLNVYKDFGNFGGFIPYVGAGIGAAYHQLDDVYFTDNPSLTNRIKGDNDLSLA